MLTFRKGLLALIFGSIEADVMASAQIYFLFTAMSYPFLALYNAGAAIFRAMGNSKISMRASLVMNLINLCGNALLIFVFKLGAAGAAIATLFARMVGAGIMMYLAIAIALVASYVLTRTRVGLHLRAVGENPATADAVGINVTGYKYVATCIGSGVAALGGLFYIMDYSGSYEAYKSIEALGWLAIALVIFTLWRPHISIIGSILFGALYLAGSHIPTLLGIQLDMSATPLLQMLPYAVTIIVLIVTSVRKNRESQPPASLGLSYFREER
jgi:simple sugar transport system permease protein